jgi:uncharacterized SAM-binding protein YcdF (DUF218 family)
MDYPIIKGNKNHSFKIKTLKFFIAPIFITYFLILFTYRIWLPLAADFLTIQSSPHQADLIVVATPFRPRFLYAVDLMQKGYAGQILLVGDTRIKEVWSGSSSLDLAKKEAIKLGIPESKIHIKYSTGTRIDAMQAKSLMTSLRVQSALVVSDPYNMRRLSMIFNFVFKDSSFNLTFVPTNQKRDSPDYWWISPHSFVYVIKEWIKLPLNYYLLHSSSTTDLKNIPLEPEDESIGEFNEPKLETKLIYTRNFLPHLIRLIKYKIGEFLVSDQNIKTHSVIITPKLSSNILTCYKNGTCNKIYLLSTTSAYTRAMFDSSELKNKTNSKAEELKIKLDDLIFVPKEIGEVYETTIFLNRFMSKNDLKSAILFLPYYETEKFQFYFRRFLNSELSINIKPLEARYKHLLEQWISNTGLSNIYLDQYLIMAHYYFNKILWTSSK